MYKVCLSGQRYPNPNRLFLSDFILQVNDMTQFLFPFPMIIFFFLFFLKNKEFVSSSDDKGHFTY